MDYLKHIGAAVVVALGLSACNTIEGIGEDVEAGGEAISETAEDTKEKL
ncbi:entericidin A/B family lipoprotein [Denitrobaculum tricleocarpae]|uniref:Entericidin A/B family lipoprotein n=1 Tax=Denitrobaculum tricleocarpae TaxID=2591009 RepID=A0A545SYQ5_9PROT|nr:entericidin A/B family lipoprotein [Denitrobaculum tricleocarpae]TQV70106.1 entericidin A/B family lipoprotein [Denitrobaculum tricleocarpae]